MRLLTGAVVDRANQRRERDAARRERDVAHPVGVVPTISVVIPALDEELLLPRCLASLEDQIEHELILVDGGSRDGTVEIADCAGALIERSPRANRGLQLNLQKVLLNKAEPRIQASPF